MQLALLDLFFITLVITIPPSDQAIDLKLIAGKSQLEIEAVLGKPSSEDYQDHVQKRCHCKRILFKDNLIAITFVNGMSDWIWVYEGADISNIKAAPIKQYHKFKDFVFIKVQTVNNNVCCGL
jgi:hypothetical protein